MSDNAPEPDVFERPAALWAASFTWWTTSGVLSAINYHEMSRLDGPGVTWKHALRTVLLSAWVWVPLTVAIFGLARRHPIERAAWGRAVAVHAAGAAGVVLLRASVIHGANRWIGWYDLQPSFGSVLLTSVDHNLLLYWMFVGVAHARHFAQRSRERAVHASRLEAQLARARLTALEAQLHPHFLFNTLHSLSELVHRDVEAADQVIVKLSEILRVTLDGGTAHEVRLREELELLAPYLDLEQVRFGDRLSVDWDIDPSALDACVPHWILQPLIENALRHGLGQRAAPGRLRIVARTAGGRLELEVRDDGAGLSTGWEARRGVGLANTRARLRELHGEDQRFTLGPAPGGGAVATIDIPLARDLEVPA